MKFLKQILFTVGLLAVALNASAQFNLFEQPRIIALTYPKTITATDSNSVIDIHGYEGVGTVYITGTTNQSTNVTTAQLFTSPDRTNWTALTYALATSNAVVYTNLNYGSGTPLATNTVMRAGTKTTPTAATAGFATSYISPALYTNNGAINLGQGLAVVGFVIPDAGRYLQISYVIGGTTTNSVSATFTGIKQQE